MGTEAGRVPRSGELMGRRRHLRSQESRRLWGAPVAS